MIKDRKFDQGSYPSYTFLSLWAFSEYCTSTTFSMIHLSNNCYSAAKYLKQSELFMLLVHGKEIKYPASAYYKHG